MKPTEKILWFCDSKLCWLLYSQQGRLFGMQQGLFMKVTNAFSSSLCLSGATLYWWVWLGCFLLREGRRTLSHHICLRVKDGLRVLSQSDQSTLSFALWAVSTLPFNHHGLRFDSNPIVSEGHLLYPTPLPHSFCSCWLMPAPLPGWL